MKEKLKQLRNYKLFRRGRTYKIAILASLIIGALGAAVTFYKSVHAVDIQEGIAKEIIRFHVLANSDSEEDQALKMKVKEHVIYEMKDLLSESKGIEDTRAILLANKKRIAGEAERVIEAEGYYHKVQVELIKDYFPIKTYGDCTFPAGEYEALRIRIGKAEGKNWWCVLYPNLCFIDATHAVVPEEEKEELKDILTKEEYDTILKDGKVKVKFKVLEDLFKIN
jgi:stage II sporulation protein R